MIRLQLYLFICIFFLTIVGIGGECSRLQNEQSRLVAHNGFILGNEEGPRPKMIIGVGDSIERLKERNPYLEKFSIAPRGYIQLPFLRSADFRYDDGAWKFEIGCSRESDVDGNEQFKGVNTVNVQLCEPSVNNWESATRRAKAMIDAFIVENPAAREISDWLETATASELESMGGRSWTFPVVRWRVVKSIDEANSFFSERSSLKDEEIQLKGLGASVLLGAYANDNTVMLIGVGREKKWGGENLTELQRNEYNYVVSIGFRLRQDSKLRLHSRN